MIAILDGLIAAEERKQEDTEQFHKVPQKFTMFPTNKFDGTEPSKAYNHSTDFMRYYRYATDNNVLHVTIMMTSRQYLSYHYQVLPSHGLEE